MGKAPKTSRTLVQEICYRVVSSVYVKRGWDCVSVIEMAELLAERIDELIAIPNHIHEITCNSLDAAILWSEILDTIDQEIPAITGRFDLIIMCTRLNRKVGSNARPKGA